MKAYRNASKIHDHEEIPFQIMVDAAREAVAYRGSMELAMIFSTFDGSHWRREFESVQLAKLNRAFREIQGVELANWSTALMMAQGE